MCLNFFTFMVSPKWVAITLKLDITLVIRSKPRVATILYSESPKMMQKNSVLTRRSFALQTCGAVAVAGTLWTAWAQEPTIQDQVWQDSTRSRAIPALIRWPAQQAKGVVVFSHGAGGRREGADVWGKAWALAGLVVVHLQHAGSDRDAMRGGISSIRKAVAPEQLLTRVDDIRFALDEIEQLHSAKTERWAELVDRKIGVSGHSFGARSTQAIAGMDFPKAADWKPQDPRPAAFLAFSPAIGLGSGVILAQAAASMAAVTRPFLVVTGSLDGDVLNNGESPQSRRMVFDSLPAGRKALLWLDGADHFTFGGAETTIRSNALFRREPDAVDKEVEHHKLVARVSTQWWAEQLMDAGPATPTGLAAADIWQRG